MLLAETGHHQDFTFLKFLSRILLDFSAHFANSSAIHGPPPPPPAHVAQMQGHVAALLPFIALLFRRPAAGQQLHVCQTPYQPAVFSQNCVFRTMS